MFIYGGLTIVLPGLHTGAASYVSGGIELIGFVLVTFFHTNPSQAYNPVSSTPVQ
jgi:hypothetical protein